MVDNYANYFCQRLLSSCSPSQRIYFLTQISGKIVEISKDKKGTHTMQSILDVMTMDEEEKVIAECLKGHVYDLAMDPQATHVVQKALASFNKERKSFIIEEATEKFVNLCNSANGLCLIKKLIPECRNDPIYYKKLISIMAENSMTLVQNPYGNYAIQTTMDTFTLAEYGPILDSLKGKFAQLSMLKFSSNVVEKCLEKADLARRNELIKELASEDKLLCMISDLFI